MKLKVIATTLFCALGLSQLGCPNLGIICSTGLHACGGTACVDYQSDGRNCGGCGLACQVGQACVAGKCECQAGSSLCDGACVVVGSDPRHCGGCGTPCTADQVCESGTCRGACVLGTSSLCGSSCVNLAADPTNCGACGKSCPDNQSCHAGRCQYDVVAACFSVGQVVGLQASTGNLGPAKPLGAGPQALAAYGDVLVAADGVEQTVRQARLPGLSEVGTAQATAASPNHVFVELPYLYLVTSVGNTLLVLQQQYEADGGVGTLTKLKSGEVDLGANTSPQAIAKVGTRLYIPLYGGAGAQAAAGQKVLMVDVFNPAAPVVGSAVDLSGINLKAFDGGTAIARPYGIVSRGGKLYVPLNNLDPSYKPAGPGMVARIDPAAGNAVSTVELPVSGCLNAVAVAPSADGGMLYVSCAGNPTYDSNYNLLANSHAGVVALGPDDRVVGSWSASCPPGADAGCVPPMPGRIAVRGNRVFVADQSIGRVFILEDTGAALVERRGYADGGTPVQACASNSFGFGNVADLVSIP